MSVNLPPQAYTREVMGQAYEWLQSQPPKVREMATSMDAVVGLFLQHRRRGDSAPMSTSPISSQKFKENLQSLADGMKKFESSQNPKPQPQLDFSDKTPPSPPKPTYEAPSPKQDNPPPMSFHLNTRTQQNLERVRQSLNLSSHDEALRMLVELGFERIKEILPKS